MIIIINNWRLDTPLSALIHTETGEMRRLGEYQFLLLQTLADHADEVLSRQFLMSEVWANRIVGSNSLPTAIHSLRTALEDNGKQQEIIKTIPKKGYMLNGDFLVVHQDNVEQAATGEDNVMETSVEPDSIKVIPVETGSVRDTDISAKAPRKWLAIAYCFALLAICLGFTILSFKYSPSDKTKNNSPIIYKQNYPAVKNITFSQLSLSGGAGRPESGFTHHISGVLEKTDALLNEKKVTLEVIYAVSLEKISLSLLFRNRCNATKQLSLVMVNWENHDLQTGEAFYNSINRVLNEMEVCNV